MSNIELNSHDQSGKINDSKIVKVPDTFVIIFFVALFAWLLTYLVPVGFFETETVSYQSGDTTKTRTVLKAGTFQYLEDESGEKIYRSADLFSSSSNQGLLNFAYEGGTSGSRNGGAVAVIMFILLTGGAFGIIMKTGVIDKGIIALIGKTRGKELLFIPLMFILFSIGGAVFGMGEEAIVFALMLCPLMVAMGYDSVVAVCITYVATQIGFATSSMNPFSIAIAQGIAGIPLLSGAGFRMVIWSIFTLAATAYVMLYAFKIKRDPTLSYSYQSDEYFRQEIQSQKDKPKEAFNLGDTLILTAFVLGIAWIIWGVMAKGYYIPEIASQFFTMGLVCGLIAVVFKVNSMDLNKIASGFKHGAEQLLPAALIVGLANGIVYLLGGSKADEPSVLNTILFHAGESIEGLPAALSAWLMYVFQSVFNFFVTSGSGQAGLTMPLMAPLADLAGVSRQIAVLAFQLGDGITNIIVPTSAALMGTLGAARMEWLQWMKFATKFFMVMFAMASVAMVIAVSIGYQ